MMTLIDRNESRQIGRAELLLISALFFLALVGGIYISRSVFDSVPHVEDEQAYLFQAKVFASGMICAKTPAQPEFFEIPFVVNQDGKWFGKYTPGYPLILMIGVLAGQPWLVNPVLGALGIVLLYYLGKSLYGWRIGLLAAVLGLVSPMYMMQTGSFMSHPATLDLVLIFFLSFVKVYRGGPRIYAILAGGTLGMALLTRPLTGFAIGIPFLVLGLVDAWAGGPPKFKKYLIMAAAFLPVALLWPGFNYAVTGDPFKNTYELWWSFDKIGFGPSYGLGGHTFAHGIDNTIDNVTLMANDLFGWPFYLSLVFVPFALMFPRKGWDWLLLALFLAVGALYVSYWTPGIMYGPRYYYETLPALLILSAKGIVVLGERLDSLIRRVFAAGRVPCMLLLSFGICGLVVSNFADYLPRDMTIYHDWDGINGDRLRIVQKAGIHNSLVFVEKGSGWPTYGSVISGVEPNLNGDVVYAIDQERANVWLMAQYPGREYYLLTPETLKRLNGNGIVE